MLKQQQQQTMETRFSIRLLATSQIYACICIWYAWNIDAVQLVLCNWMIGFTSLMHWWRPVKYSTRWLLDVIAVQLGICIHLHHAVTQHSLEIAANYSAGVFACFVLYVVAVYYSKNPNISSFIHIIIHSLGCLSNLALYNRCLYNNNKLNIIK
jgi:hypothetical protein